jgi:hypothetical protein
MTPISMLILDMITLRLIGYMQSRPIVDRRHLVFESLYSVACRKILPSNVNFTSLISATDVNRGWLLRWCLDGLVWVVVAFAMLPIMLLLTTLFKTGGDGEGEGSATMMVLKAIYHLHLLDRRCPM